MFKLYPATLETPKGADVLVIEDAGCGATVTQTRSEPWSLGDGTLVVQLIGRTGGYRLDRVFEFPADMLRPGVAGP